MHIICKKIKDKKELKKGIRGLDFTKLDQELKLIEMGKCENMYRHPIKFNGLLYGSYEAKTLNKHFNYKGPGDFRYLTFKQQIIGLARHGRGENGYIITFTI